MNALVWHSERAWCRCKIMHVSASIWLQGCRYITQLVWENHFEVRGEKPFSVFANCLLTKENSSRLFSVCINYDCQSPLGMGVLPSQSGSTLVALVSQLCRSGRLYERQQLCQSLNSRLFGLLRKSLSYWEGGSRWFSYLKNSLPYTLPDVTEGQRWSVWILFQCSYFARLPSGVWTIVESKHVVPPYCVWHWNCSSFQPRCYIFLVTALAEFMALGYILLPHTPWHRLYQERLPADLWRISHSSYYIREGLHILGNILHTMSLFVMTCLTSLQSFGLNLVLS